VTFGYPVSCAVDVRIYHVITDGYHFTYLFLYLDKSYCSLIALILPVIFTYFVISST